MERWGGGGWACRERPREEGNSIAVSACLEYLRILGASRRASYVWVLGSRSSFFLGGGWGSPWNIPSAVGGFWWCKSTQVQLHRDTGKTVTAAPSLGFSQCLDGGMGGSVVDSDTAHTDVHVCLKASCCVGAVSAVFSMVIGLGCEL